MENNVSILDYYLLAGGNFVAIKYNCINNKVVVTYIHKKTTVKTNSN